MMISMFAMAAAATAMQSDTTRAAREAFTSCLRTYVDRSVQGAVTQDVFDREYPQQCSAQQQAFRDAVIARESGLRATRANAEDQANLEIEDARVNFSERFVPPREAPAAQAAVATPAATPAAQPASSEEAPVQPN